MTPMTFLSKCAETGIVLLSALYDWLDNRTSRDKSELSFTNADDVPQGASKEEQIVNEVNHLLTLGERDGSYQFKECAQKHLTLWEAYTQVYVHFHDALTSFWKAEFEYVYALKRHDRLSARAKQYHSQNQIDKFNQVSKQIKILDSTILRLHEVYISKQDYLREVDKTKDEVFACFKEQDERRIKLLKKCAGTRIINKFTS